MEETSSEATMFDCFEARVTRFCSIVAFSLIQFQLWTLHALADVSINGKMLVGRAMTLEVAGPRSDEQADINPFLHYRMTVEFKSEHTTYAVPGYFAADGKAAHTSATAGDVWRAHFVPDSPGTWQYRVSFRQGPAIALDTDIGAGQPAPGDGQTGNFHVSANPGARGMLRHVGKRYLQFDGSGEFYLKSGADSPENLLAYRDFDGTSKIASVTSRGEAKGIGLHQYLPHVQDWKPGDPTWKDQRGKGLIGAVNYLASQGVNSIYFLTMNVRGDGNDVWPWTSADERFRFDCSKLDQWEIIFSHMDRLNIALHVVLTETENESLLEHEEANEFARRRKLYYRELIARFGHHRALVWNLGEENGWDDREDKNALDEPWRIANTTNQRKQFARYIKLVDPYDHPIVVHTLPGRYDEIYAPLLGDAGFDGVSLQVQLGPKIHEETKKWIARSGQAGRQWFANLDEIGPAAVGVKPDADDPDHDDVRRYALWGNLMGGGAGCEWYFGYQLAHNDLNLEDFRSRQRMWQQTRQAVDFFHDHLKFWEMESADELCQSEGAYCLADPNSTYVLYVPAGGVASLDLPPAEFSVHWFDPRHGGPMQHGSRLTVLGRKATDVGNPPANVEKDWVALIKRANESRAANGAAVKSSTSGENENDDGVGKPNILFIAIDDQNDWFGCLGGHPQAKTPHIDSLARRGTLFTNAHCQSPLCNSSRTSLMTGLRPSTTGIYGLAPWFRDVEQFQDLVTLPQYLASHGYRTYSTGKIYHGGYGRKSTDHEFHVIGPAAGVGVKPPAKLVQTPSPHPLVDWGVFPHRDQDKGDWKVATWAVEQLDARPEEPFFLSVGFFLPHVPCYATQKWFDLYPADELVLPAIQRDDRDDTPRFSWYLHWKLPEPRLKFLEESNQWKNLVRSYLACTSFVDSQVGRVLTALDRNGFGRNTIVVLWSDHGWHLGEKLITGKNTLWDRSARVPLIFAGPGITADARCNKPAELLDIYPTLVELCRLPRRSELEGRSLMPQLVDASAPRLEPAITTHNHDNHGIRSENWRYIRYADGSEELYDMLKDANEWNNLAGVSQYLGIVNEHRKWIPKINRKPAPESRARILVYDGHKATWQGEEIGPNDSIPELD